MANSPEPTAPAATLRDVAELASVHYTTASRALSGKTDIHVDTALRVRAAAAELGYRPNMHAQALRRNSPQPVFGVITDPVSMDELSRYSQPFWLAMLMGITRHLAEEGISVIQVTSSSSGLLEPLPVSGLLLLSIVDSPLELPGRLSDVPLIVERTHSLAPQAVATIGHDHQRIAREACNYLHARGARNVAYLPLSNRDQLSVAAASGYRQWCEDMNQAVWVIEPSIDPGAQQAAVQSALREGVDGIYATTGELGPLLTAIRAEALNCPDEVQVVCIGEGVVERLLTPALTSFSLQGAQCAKDIANVIQSVVERREVTDVTFGYQLVARGSTRS